MNKFPLCLLLCLIVVFSVSAAPEDNNNTPPGQDNNEGIPQRVALVEKVLEVEKLTKQPTLDLKGTDYQPGDDGKILAYVLEGQQPVTDALCLVSVLYPNHTVFIDQELMFEFNKTVFSGLYFLNFVVPNVTGVYPVAAYCFYGTTTLTDIPDSDWGNLTESESSGGLTVLSPNIEGIQEFEKNSECNNNECVWEWNFTVPSGAVSEYLSDARVILKAHTDANEDFHFYVHNYLNDTDDYFSTYSSGDPIDPAISQFVFPLLINTTPYVSDDEKITVRMKVYDFDTTGQHMEIYDLYISRIYNATVVQDMRGSNEIVVSSAIYNQTLILQQDDITLVNDAQLAQWIIIIMIIVLFLTGYWMWMAPFGVFYSFIYLDGILAVVVAVIMAFMFYIGYHKKKDGQE